MVFLFVNVSIDKLEIEILALILDKFLNEYFHLLEFIELNEEEEKQIIFLKKNHKKLIEKSQSQE